LRGPVELIPPLPSPKGAVARLPEPGSQGARARPVPPRPPGVEPNREAPAAAPVVAPAARRQRPRVHGKFFYRGDEKLYLRGITYGTFRPDADGNLFLGPEVVARDFAMMAASGINVVRTYTVPPRWLLDAAMEHGLSVMVGLYWEQHMALLDDRKRTAAAIARVREGAHRLAGHEALFAFTIGNEIPASVVRWHGKPRVERHIERLAAAVKQEDPEALVTYVSFPTTEYLELPGLDFVSFNVYLEARQSFEAYLARLQNLAGDRPLVLAEIGLDSRSKGVAAQAETLRWQLGASFAGGCAGTFVFAWTDEWHCGGNDIHDWDFGLVGRDRSAKPALDAVRQVYAEVPFSRGGDWPRVSVVVCSYNGARTIRETLEHLARVEYPSFEVIVVDDGSTDDTAAIAAEFDVRLVRTPNGGLSRARNVGLEAATGEIISYVDDDAYPDPHYLHYLAHAFRSGCAAAGGPNLPPAGDGFVADAVAHAPGGPLHVLTSDTIAEHIPGCNFAVRRDWLAKIGGFDASFRIAGDDVDACWRLVEAGGRIEFHHAALVWHHRRNSVVRYLKQQRGYGRAEALLERKWPQKYTGLGHMRWNGQLYGRGIARALRLAPNRIYHGPWGLAPFQSLYAPAPSWLAGLLQTPEWYLVTALLFAVGVGGFWFKPLLAALCLAAAGATTILLQAVASTRRVEPSSRASRWARLRLRVLTTALHVLQPVARLVGRLEYGLHPWRRSRAAARGRARGWTFATTESLWSEQWREASAWLEGVCAHLRGRGAAFLSGRDFDAWDLQIEGGLFGRASVLMVIEEHGKGKQLVRFRFRPRARAAAVGLAVGLGLTSAFLRPLAPAAAVAAAGLAAFTVRDIGAAIALGREAVRASGGVPVGTE
jgi:GT2 family glycosyltransferase